MTNTKAAEGKPAKTFWEERSTRTIRGLIVNFYKRSERGAFVMDFHFGSHGRVQRSTDMFTVGDAARVAELNIRKLQEDRQGLTVEEQRKQIQRGRVATLAAVMRAMEHGDKVCAEASTRVYLSSLKRLAVLVSETAPEEVTLDLVLCRENLLRFYSRGQANERGGVDWVSKRECNGGLNTCIRNTRALFNKDMVQLKMSALKLPDLTALRELSYLPEMEAGFEPWAPAVYARMEAESQRLPQMQASGPLMQGLLVRARLRLLEDGHPARELGVKAGVLVELGESRAVVEWACDGEVIRHELPLEAVLPVAVDYQELWLVCTMLRRLGLRDAELEAAHSDWLEERPDGRGGLHWVLALRQRPDFDLLKHGRPRNLVLDAELCALLRQRKGFLIGPQMTAAARKELIGRHHNTWLRQFIPDREKGNHELRMWAGSIVYMRSGLAAAQYFLGHKSQVTTERYYARWFESSPALDAQAVALTRVAAAL